MGLEPPALLGVEKGYRGWSAGATESPRVRFATGARLVCADNAHYRMVDTSASKTI
jgi:hypothetical protein